MKITEKIAEMDREAFVQFLHGIYDQGFMDVYDGHEATDNELLHLAIDLAGMDIFEGDY